MKYLFFSCIVAAALFACKNKDQKHQNAVLNAARDSANYTTITWLDSVVDFGIIKNGEKISIKFRCRNSGDKPLIIISARPGCGCTVADYTKGPILPGSEGLVTASFDSKRFSGEVHKYIEVSTNTKNGTEHTLSFTGTITGGPSNDKIVLPHAVK
jgi:hypothetical protein